MLLIRDVTRDDYLVVKKLLDSNDLGVGGAYYPEGQEVIVADLDGSVVGIAEFQFDCDFGRDEGRLAHPGGQAWILTMAVAEARRRRGVGRALVTEIARRARDAGHTFLALVPQEGDDAADRGTFFQACGLAPIEPDGPGAAWGCPVAQILAGGGAAPVRGR
ncbi:GNAT family N-acetyltransferase [Streptomyces sp. NBC_00334]|uniref:GNAT family N-acetyltransferase n=1 Tax=Streptomyces sp. NBC_00334 TaxID=2975713 RepID=UPI002E2C5ED4|nr:GNAT family N-acetyltransferase [Streptomyces sp. NBC_00334]